jgi:hypothetical protein
MKETKRLVLGLLGFLESHNKTYLKFNFNPDQIIIAQTSADSEPYLHPPILLEMNQETLKVNQCLKVWWNIVLDESDVEEKLLLIEKQNKLGLA